MALHFAFTNSEAAVRRNYAVLSQALKSQVHRNLLQVRSGRLALEKLDAVSRRRYRELLSLSQESKRH